MYPTNSHVVRAASAADEHALRRLAKVAGRSPLEGRVVVAEVEGAVAAAVSRDDGRTLADGALAPTYLTAMLRAQVQGMNAFERQPDLGERVAEALRSPRSDERVPLAA
jgi:hypothetical protein